MRIREIGKKFEQVGMKSFLIWMQCEVLDRFGVREAVCFILPPNPKREGRAVRQIRKDCVRRGPQNGDEGRSTVPYFRVLRLFALEQHFDQELRKH